MLMTTYLVVVDGCGSASEGKRKERREKREERGEKRADPAEEKEKEQREGDGLRRPSGMHDCMIAWGVTVSPCHRITVSPYDGMILHGVQRLCDVLGMDHFQLSLSPLPIEGIIG